MKKKILLSLILLPLLAACSTAVIKPKADYPGIPDYPDPEEPGGGGGEGGGGGDLPAETNMTVNFFVDYSHSDKPYYTMEWYSLVPLKECPADAVLTDADAEDPLYSHFLGFSEYPSSIDDSKLWNFETDYKQSNTLNLYGIWVAE